MKSFWSSFWSRMKREMLGMVLSSLLLGVIPWGLEVSSMDREEPVFAGSGEYYLQSVAVIFIVFVGILFVYSFFRRKKSEGG